MWAIELVGVVEGQKAHINTEQIPAADADKLTSDAVLEWLRPSMQDLGYTVETGKKRADKITRPVLFGDDGTAEVNYEIDAFHDEMGIAVEVEAGCGAMSNAEYRDIIRMSLLLDANYMVLMMPLVYRYGGSSHALAYNKTRGLLSAMYASERLRLPFAGSLVIGY